SWAASGWTRESYDARARCTTRGPRDCREAPQARAPGMGRRRCRARCGSRPAGNRLGHRDQRTPAGGALHLPTHGADRDRARHGRRAGGGRGAGRGKDGVLYEVTTFRRDVETDGRHAVVRFADRIEDDLARRDFTINALAWDPATKELYDPYGGLDDIAARVIRTVGNASERFAEDYLRVLRALRFAGHLDYTVDGETWTALREATPKLTRLSVERVREELTKVLQQTPRASRTLELY